MYAMKIERRDFPAKSPVLPRPIARNAIVNAVLVFMGHRFSKTISLMWKYRGSFSHCVVYLVSDRKILKNITDKKIFEKVLEISRKSSSWMEIERSGTIVSQRLSSLSRSDSLSFAL